MNISQSDMLEIISTNWTIVDDLGQGWQGLRYMIAGFEQIAVYANAPDSFREDLHLLRQVALERYFHG